MRTIIFDFDGTIADSFDFVLDFLVKKSGKQPMMDMADRLSYRRLSMVGIARRLGIAWVRLPGLLYSGRRDMARNMPDVQPVEGMPELIAALHADGHQLMILSTNSGPMIRKFLEHRKLSKYFLKVVGSVGAFGKAPALRRITRTYQLSPKDCIYIGDEVRDIEASAAIGMDSIAVAWGFADKRFLSAVKPLAVVETPAELKSAIARLKDL